MPDRAEHAAAVTYREVDLTDQAAVAVVADEPFVPILMSQSGYGEIFGYRGRTVGESAEDAKEAWLDEET